MSENKNIQKVEAVGDNQRIFFTNGNYIEVPSLVNGQALPLVDPYDKANGNGFMVQNAIIDSKLSANAKIVYCALRRHICYNTGFTFVDLYKPKEKKTETDALTLEDTTSLTRNPIKTALEELEHFKVIIIGKYLFRGARKNIYVFKPMEHWSLPTKESAEQYHGEITAKRKAKEKERQERKEKTKEDIPVQPPEANIKVTAEESDNIYLDEDIVVDDIGNTSDTNVCQLENGDTIEEVNIRIANGTATDRDWGKFIQSKSEQMAVGSPSDNEMIKQNTTDDIFRFAEGEYTGETMQDVYDRDWKYVFDLAESSPIEAIRNEAQRIMDLDEMP